MNQFTNEFEATRVQRGMEETQIQPAQLPVVQQSVLPAKDPPANPNLIHCMACLEPISRITFKCPHCGEPTLAAREAYQSQQREITVFVAICLALLAAAAFMMLTGG